MSPSLPPPCRNPQTKGDEREGGWRGEGEKGKRRSWTMPPPNLSRRPAAYRIGVGVWGRSLQGGGDAGGGAGHMQHQVPRAGATPAADRRSWGRDGPGAGAGRRGSSGAEGPTRWSWSGRRSSPAPRMVG